ncbi:hypothetical protein BaRGS_00006563 [Batillaria attramentaria]|uniref:39S ribosomal protein L13, mitochondrial n=1 Tax=Batillaria attramentaria TaxID=370345 RepID=A0ABD0LRM3_9CAEN
MAYRRVQQWSVFARTWWLYDAAHQCPNLSAHRVIPYLQGKHKPIYHPLSDVGDHVVVINTKEVAMQGEYWRRFKYFHHTGYPGGFSEASAWRVHEIDPTRVMHQAVYCRLPGNLLRKGLMRRLHLYPDDAVPDEIMENISDQIRQVQEIPKRLDEYTEEEIQEFPKLFDCCWYGSMQFYRGVVLLFQARGSCERRVQEAFDKEKAEETLHNMNNADTVEQLVWWFEMRVLHVELHLIG